MAFIYFLLLVVSAIFAVMGSPVAGRLLGPILMAFFLILFAFSMVGGFGERHAK